MPPNRAFHLQSVASPIPWRRQTSAVDAPRPCSARIATIRSSVTLGLRTSVSSRDGLPPQVRDLEGRRGLRSLVASPHWAEEDVRGGDRAMGRRVCEEPDCGAALYPGDEGGLCFTCSARRGAARVRRRLQRPWPRGAQSPRDPRRRAVPSPQRSSHRLRLLGRLRWHHPAGPDAPPPSPAPARSAGSRPLPHRGPAPRPGLRADGDRGTGRACSVLPARRAEAAPTPLPRPTLCAEPGCGTPVRRSATGCCASHAASRARARRPRLRPIVCQHRGCEAPISRWSKSGRCRRHALKVRLDDGRTPEKPDPNFKRRRSPATGADAEGPPT